MLKPLMFIMTGIVYSLVSFQTWEYLFGVSMKGFHPLLSVMVLVGVTIVCLVAVKQEN